MQNKLQIILNNSSGEKKDKKLEDISKKSTKIEKLKKDLENLVKKIKKIKEKVDAEAKETLEILYKTKEDYILLLAKKHQHKELMLWQKDLCLEMIQKEYELLQDMGYDSEILKETLNAILKESLSNLSPFEKEMRDQTIRRMFEEMDIELDDDINFEEMTDANFKKRMEDEFHKREQREKDFLKEKQVANTDIDFQKLYKKLAKLSHPDLCKTELEKAEKEILMKQLTEAWEKRDYYEILMLWIEIDPENTIGLELNEKNQKSIIKQLNAKIQELEYEDYKLKNYFEDTAFYYKNFNAPSEKATSNKIKKYITHLEEDIKITTEKAFLFQKTTHFKNYLKEIYEEREENELDPEDFQHFFGTDFDED